MTTSSLRMLLSKRLLAGLNRSLLGNADRVSGAFLVIVAGIALAEAIHLPFGSVRAPDAGFFPQSLSILLLIFGLGIFFNSFISRSEPAQFNSQFVQVAVAAAAFVVYALVVDKAGYVIATILIMLLVMRGLGGMKWRQALLIAVPSVVLSYLAFIELGVPLPSGLLPY
jgi:hypothetical protein